LSKKGRDLIPIIEEMNKNWEEQMGLDKLDSEFFIKLIELSHKSAKLNGYE